MAAAPLGAGRRVQVEFVSANPTGPLHVGHGRGAAYGAVVADLLAAVGFEVHREYYVNDAGRQMDILATSVWLRYLELCGEELDFPSNGYKGDYVWDIAATLHREHGDAYRVDGGGGLRRGSPRMRARAGAATRRPTSTASSPPPSACSGTTATAMSSSWGSTPSSTTSATIWPSSASTTRSGTRSAP